MLRRHKPSRNLLTSPRRTLYLLLILTLLLGLITGAPVPLAAGTGVWSQMDLDQIQVTALAVDPTNPNIIVAGTSGQGAFRSIDAGRTWNPINSGLANLFVNDVLISPADPTLLLAATGRGPLVGEASAGVYRSTDRGNSWTRVLSGFAGDLDVSAQNAQILYAAGAPPIFRSTDGGLTWTGAFTDSTVFQNVDMRAVAVSPTDSNTVLVGGATEGGSGSVFRTTNGGLSWTRVQDTSVPAVNAIVYSPTNAQQAFYGNSQGIWRSRDGGVTWTLVFGGPAALGLLPDPVNSNILYAGTSGQGVLQTINGGDSFQTFGTDLGNLVVHTLGLDRTAPQTIWAGTDDGAWAFTQSTAGQLPALTITPASGPPGTVVTFSGTGFTPGGRASVLLVRSIGIVVSTPTADQSGNITGSFTMPNPATVTQLEFGPVDVFAADAVTSRQTLSVAFTLSQPSQATTWYFAEGSTQAPFDTWYLVQNPTESQSRVRFTFFLDDVTTPVSEFLVAPQSRFSLFANQILPGRALSVRIDADQRVFAERSMFVGFDGNDVAGIPGPSTTWLFAEGSTQPPFHTWLLLQNPNSTTVTANITYLVQGGAALTQSVSLPPTSRTSIFTNDVIPDVAFSTQVQSSGPIIVERSMFRFPGNAATDVSGVNQPAQTWFFAEGNSSAQGLPTDTWLLLQNPGVTQVQATITIFREGGGQVGFAQTLAPSSRTSILLTQAVQGSFGIRVDASAPIIAERSMFLGTEPRGAAATVGSPTLATTWYLAEGSTAPPFDEVITVMNPNGQNAAVDIEFQLQTGTTVVRSFVVAAQSKLSIQVDEIIPSDAVSALVTSSVPVVVERAMYINKLGSVGLSTKIGIQ